MLSCNGEAASDLERGTHKRFHGPRGSTIDDLWVSFAQYGSAFPTSGLERHVEGSLTRCSSLRVHGSDALFFSTWHGMHACVSWLAFPSLDLSFFLWCRAWVYDDGSQQPVFSRSFRIPVPISVSLPFFHDIWDTNDREAGEGTHPPAAARTWCRERTTAWILGSIRDRPMGSTGRREGRGRWIRPSNPSTTNPSSRNFVTPASPRSRPSPISRV